MNLYGEKRLYLKSKNISARVINKNCLLCLISVVSSHVEGVSCRFSGNSFTIDETTQTFTNANIRAESNV